MSNPIVYKQDDILFSKATIFAALQSLYPTEMAGLTLQDLVAYYPDDDASFTRFEFVQKDIDGVLFQRTILKFQKGDILKLLQSLDPNHFGNKTKEQLVSYADDLNDPSMVRFVFQEVEQ